MMMAHPSLVARVSIIPRLQHKRVSVGRAWSSAGSGCTEFDALAEWVTFHGGYVHPSLTLGLSPELNIRGVVCREPLSDNDIRERPLIELPDKLRMTEIKAMEILSPATTLFNLPSIQTLSDEMQVALLLAHEKRKGTKSHWSPYIETIPKDPPCAWTWSSKELEEYFQKLPADSSQRLVDNFYKFLPTHQELLDAQIEDTVEVFGDAFDVGTVELTWCVAQVQSRAFSTTKFDVGAALHPVVDLLNHSDAAAYPLGMHLEGEDLTCVGALDAMEAGDEFFVNYGLSEGESPLLSLLKFGFIPKSLLAYMVDG